MITHRCPVPGCIVNNLPASLLMCRAHWRLVPGDAQAAVWRAYRAHQQGRGTLRELRTVQAEAVAAVEK